MNSQISKAALRGLEQAEWLATSTAAQEPTVSAGLAELYRSILPPGDETGCPDAGCPDAGRPDAGAPDFQAAQSANVRLLEHSAHKMRQADQTHRQNRTELEKMRRRRRTLARSLKQSYRAERQFFAGTYGEQALADVGLDAPPGLSFLALREQMLELRQRLRDPETPARLGDPRSGHRPIDPQTLADALDDGISAYDTLMSEVREQEKKTEESKIRRLAALARHCRVVVNVARIQEGYYRLVGLDELADRIRAADEKSRGLTATAEGSDYGAGRDHDAAAVAAPRTVPHQDTRAAALHSQRPSLLRIEGRLRPATDAGSTL